MELMAKELLAVETCRFEFHGEPDRLHRPVQGVSIDSRTVQPGELFFALRGERHDGHDFLGDVFAAEALAAVVERDRWPRLAKQFEGEPVFIVEDSLRALQELAHFYRKKFGLPVVAVTGTNGKTTTKEMMAAVLSQTMNVCKTEGNLNNHIGVPLTLFRLAKEHDILILEMGMNHFGEIARLCEIGDPQFGLITNIGHGHLEFVGSLEGVARAKMELFDYLKAHGTAFVNVDDPMIMRYKPGVKNEITYGFKDEARVFGRDLGLDQLGFPQMAIGDVTMKIGVPGRHNLSNALAAAAVGLEFGVDLQQIKVALEHVDPPSKRVQVLRKNDITIINDSYNANPDSTRAALRVLQEMPATGRRVFVFGDMLELGDHAEHEHASIGAALKHFDVQLFYGHGPMTRAAVEAAAQKAPNVTARHFEQKNELTQALRKVLEPGDVLLLKGSRGMKMEEILDNLF